MADQGSTQSKSDLVASEELRSFDELSNATEIFVSDIHGEYATFNRILQQVPAGTPLHVVGDVYDRGPAPDLVMDVLERYPNVDIQWGNHDVLWMGAALGHAGCVAQVVRICARYGNLSILEDTYGMDLDPLRDFAACAYKDDPCIAFGCKGDPDLTEEQLALTIRIQKALAYIQFKVEHSLIQNNPSWGLASRDLLGAINFAAGTVLIDGKDYELLDTVFPTVDPANPYHMTPDEQQVLAHLQREFCNCERLQRHIAVFLERGSLYKRLDDLLLLHACVPLNDDGSFKQVNLFGDTYAGCALFDAVDENIRKAFSAKDEQTRMQRADILWYLWLGEGSPLFAKSKMATFELYLVADKAVRKEQKNAFYSLLENDQILRNVINDFCMDPAKTRIGCGHVPVKVKEGESPLKSGGRLVNMDGGMSRPYQAKTGIAGYVLARMPDGLKLAELQQASANDPDGVPSLLRWISLPELC